jgi:hypothetical protein
MVSSDRWVVVAAYKQLLVARAVRAVREAKLVAVAVAPVVTPSHSAIRAKLPRRRTARRSKSLRNQQLPALPETAVIPQQQSAP